MPAKLTAVSIPRRIWRLLRSEVNSRLGRFDSSPQAPTYEEKTWQDVYDRAEPEASPSTLAAHYRVLELPDGAELEAVRAAYKRLMKKYHPDRFQDNAKRATATELVKKINASYAELTRALGGR